MGQQPEQDMRIDMYAELGVHATGEQIAEARQRARATLAELDAKWTPEKWAELDRRLDAA